MSFVEMQIGFIEDENHIYILRIDKRRNSITQSDTMMKRILTDVKQRRFTI